MSSRDTRPEWLMVTTRPVTARAALGMVMVALLSIDCGGDADRRNRQHDRSGNGGAPSGAGGCGAACSGLGGSVSQGAAGTSPSSGSGGTAAGGSAAAGAASSAGSAGAPSGGRGGNPENGGTAGTGDAPEGGSSSSGEGGAGEGSGGGANAPALRIAKVALYQATEVTLFEAPDNVEPNAPIIADRAAEVRVFVEPGPGFVAQDVTLSFSFVGKRGEFGASATRRISGASSVASLDSTLNFQISELDLGEDNTLRIELASGAEPAVLFDAWPPSGTAEVPGSSAGGPFRLTLVPLASGGFTPDLSPDIVDRFRSHLEALYPIPSAAITVHAPVTLATPVLADGSGWDEALDALLELRASEDPVSNEYYYGVLTPGETLDAYCPDGCTVGLSGLTSASNEAYRGAVGTGFFDFADDTFSQETLEHELGHALGRDHAPCEDTDFPEPNFPYPDGHIGVWGWDGTRLRDPAEDADVMSYCVPVWVSDYTFAGLFTRIAYVNGQAAAPFELSKVRARSLILKPDGSARWGSERPARGSFDDASARVELLDAAGRVLGVTKAHLARFDHLPGGMLALSADALSVPGLVAVRAEGVTITVP